MTRHYENLWCRRIPRTTVVVVRSDRTPPRQRGTGTPSHQPKSKRDDGANAPDTSTEISRNINKEYPTRNPTGAHSRASCSAPRCDTTSSPFPEREMVQLHQDVRRRVGLTHPGDAAGRFTPAPVRMMIQGEPTLTLHAGDGFTISPRSPHDTSSTVTPVGCSHRTSSRSANPSATFGPTPRPPLRMNATRSFHVPDRSRPSAPLTVSSYTAPSPTPPAGVTYTAPGGGGSVPLRGLKASKSAVR